MGKLKFVKNMIILMFDNEKKRNFYVAEVGLARSDDVKTWGLGLRKEYSLSIVLDGKVRINGVEVNCGEYYYNKPFEKYNLETDAVDGLKMFWLAFGGVNAERAFEDIGFKTSVCTGKLENFERIKERLDEMLFRLKSHHGKINLMQELKQVLGNYEVVTAEKTTHKTNHVEDALEYINGNLDKNLFPSFVAQYVGINEHYLSRLFKQKFGVTLQTYIANARMEKAKALLKNSNYNVSEIAIMVGFADVFLFSRFFKKAEGISPRAYRSKISAGAI